MHPPETPGTSGTNRSSWRIEKRGAGRRFLQITLLALCVAVGFLAIKLAMVPREAWESGNPDNITAALRGEWNNLNPLAPTDQLADIEEAAELAAPPGLIEQAEQWVHTVNLSLPGTILWFDADPRGNLYLVLGGWLDLLPDQAAQVTAIKNLAVAWRQFLADLIGPWDSQGGFSPGIIILDSQGIAATDLNGTFTLYHIPNDTTARTAP